MAKASLSRTTHVPTARMGRKPPAFKARVDVVDLTLRKRVASIVGYGETLDVIYQMRKECAWAVRNGGRYGCLEPEVSFLRYGSPHNGATSITFLEEPVGLEAGADLEQHPAAWDDTEDDLWESDG